MKTVRFALLLVLPSIAAEPSHKIDLEPEEYFLVEDLAFIKTRARPWGTIYSPVLSFTVANHTSSAWTGVKLAIEAAGLCDGEPQRWSLTAAMSIGRSAEFVVRESYETTETRLIGEVDGCEAALFYVAFLRGEKLGGETVVKAVQAGPSWSVELAELQKAEAERLAAEKAEADRLAAEAAEAERVALEHEKAKEANRRRDEAARAAKRKREEAARAQREEETRQALAWKLAALRERCFEIYETTSDKKVSDLTVKEAEAIDACKRLGYYQPR